MTITQIQLRRDTAANWASVNPVLAQGELGLDLTNLIIKIGDGVTAWNSLTVSIGQTPPATPPGTVVSYAGSTAPTGWLFCFGQAVSRTTYAALFTALSTVYGSGDGSTTFNLPDLRGRSVAGKDDMGGTAAGRLTGATGSVLGTTLGANGGEETHNLSVNEMPSHAHSAPAGNFLFSAWGGGPGWAGGGDYSPTNQYSLTAYTGGGVNHNNVQPTLILNSIIKT